MLENRPLSMGQARPLVGLPTHVGENLARQCIAKSWSARQMETEARKAARALTTEKKGAIDADVAALQDELTRKLGLPTQVICKANGSGELRIHYTQAAELDGVLKKLRG